MDTFYPRYYLSSDLSIDQNIRVYSFNQLYRSLPKINCKKCDLKCILATIIIVLILTLINVHIFIMKNNINDKIKNLDRKIQYSSYKTIQNSDNFINEIYRITKNYMHQIDNNFTEFDIEKHVKESIFKQTDFCLNPEKYNNSFIDDIIIKKQVIINQYDYEMYVYNTNKKADIVSSSIISSKNWEKGLLLEMKNAIEYYAKKNNITDNKSITVIDIGANIGSHTMILAKLNYSVIAFEPTEKNYYILRKNVCLNNLTNVLIFNMGLYDREKICDYYVGNNNYGNGMVLCDNDEKSVLRNEFYKVGIMNITKLRNYFPYLFTKKIALIKIDIEGGEEKAFKGGIELISKYHVPFIVSEFTERYIEKHGSSSRDYVRLFTDNGYNVSMYGFFPKKYDSLETVTVRTNELFFTYKDYAK